MSMNNYSSEEAIKKLKQYFNPTHRQHFVKKEYLSQWSKDGKRIFTINKENGEERWLSLKNVCVKNDFYRMYHYFNEVEQYIIRNYYANEKDKHIISLCENELETWQKQVSLISLVRIAMPDQEKLLNNFEIQSGEQYQTVFEKYFYDIVNKYVINKDCSFLDDELLRTQFCVGLATQYLRTDGIHNKYHKATNKIIDNCKANGYDINVEQLSLMTSNIFAILFAWQLIKNSDHFIELLISDDCFLTSDMPVVHVGDKDEKGRAINTSFFFPVTPHLAFIFPTKENQIKIINSDELRFYNKITNDNAFRFVFEHK